MEEKDQKKLALPVEWHFPEGIQSRYANNVLTQIGQYEIEISFFETQLPILVGTPEENRKKLDTLKAIRAECVSKLVISPDFLPALINALEGCLENYRQAKEQV